jgi:hypothetical protein
VAAVGVWVPPLAPAAPAVRTQLPAVVVVMLPFTAWVEAELAVEAVAAPDCDTAAPSRTTGAVMTPATAMVLCPVTVIDPGAEAK